MEEDIDISKNLLKTISADTRTDIIKLLETRQMTASEISRLLDKHVTTVSEHLGILQNSGMIERMERPGRKWVYYKLTKKADKMLHPRNYYRLTIVLSTVLVIMIASFASAANANPGDVLYPLKRFTESAQLALSTSDAQRAQLLLSFADDRLNEAKVAASRNQTSNTIQAMQAYQDNLQGAQNEIHKASSSEKNVVPLLEDASESAAKNIMILQNLENSHPQLKDDVQPILNSTLSTESAVRSELNKEFNH